jgi:hypothetical protein
VRVCLEAGIAKGEIVHVDASLIRADVSWESLAVRHVEATNEANGEVDETAKTSRQTGKYKKVCTTDPDATMATTARNRRLEPAYKQHTVVDDLRGAVLDVAVTTGEVNEGQIIEGQVDATMATTGVAIATVTADAGYAYAKVYRALERRRIDTLIPTKAEPIRSAVPLRRFRYDARHDVVKCPRGKVLRSGRRVKHGRFFYARARDCSRCSLARVCLSTAGPSTRGKQAFFNSPTRQRCQEAFSTLATAAWMPRGRLKITSLTPRRSRRVSLRRKVVYLCNCIDTFA